MGRRAPRPATLALRDALQRSAPRTPLARVQLVWSGVVGEGIAARTEPVAERAGTVTVSCESASWAQELDLMQEEILARLRERLGAEAPAGLRFESRGR